METMGILLVSHNSASEGIKDTAQMIMGELNDVEALQLRANDSPDDVMVQIEAVLDRYHGNCIILLDLFGGSPFNVVMKIAKKREDVFAVCGMNVPMLLEALVLRNNTPVKEIGKALEQCGKNSIQELSGVMSSLRCAKGNEEEEDDD